MLFCDNCNGWYHLFCLKSEVIQVLVDNWYCSSCFHVAPWFLFRPCHVFLDSSLGGDTWEFHLSLFLCIVYICAFIFCWLVSFHLWLILVFLFNRIYYGFTPLWHYTSWQTTKGICYLTLGINSLECSSRMLPEWEGQSIMTTNQGWTWGFQIYSNKIHEVLIIASSKPKSTF